MKRDSMRFWRWSLLAAVCLWFLAPGPAMAIGPYLVEAVNGQQTVLDQGTGLEWQQADNGQTYTWQGAIDYCDGLSFGGHTDWRLPNIEELDSILDYSRYSPAIDITAFQSQSDFYWSSTTEADDTDYAWVVLFGYGVQGPNVKTNVATYARCVRAGLGGLFDPFAIIPYKVNGQTVLDQNTGLEWQRTDSGQQYAWQAAIDYCENLDLGGHTDWRLPDIEELRSIVTYSRYNPAIGNAFPRVRSGDYWTSTSDTYNINTYYYYAWTVNFHYGSSHFGDKRAGGYARCVRGGFDVFEPLLTSTLSPASGEGGGAAVTINGSGFGVLQGGGSVTVDGIPASVTEWTPTRINILAPPHAAGNVAVVVTTGAKKGSQVAGGFTYQIPDCLGVLGGAAKLDNCGVCDANSANDCTQDCAGTWGGTAITDACGVCDANPANDCTPGRVLLNEIQYDQAKGGQEFVELLAIGGPVDLTGWTLTDMDDVRVTFAASDKRFPCATPFVLNPGELLVVWQGKGTPVCAGPSRAIYLDAPTFLQRDGDDLALLDAAGNCADYAAYGKGWNWDKKKIPPPAGCVWSGVNPVNGGKAGVSISRFDADPLIDTDTSADWEASGKSSTSGPMSPGVRNEKLTDGGGAPPPADTDGDGVADSLDNCPAIPNPLQTDSNGNGVGDACEAPAAAAATVLLSAVHYDQASNGKDREFVRILASAANKQPVDLSGWRLKDMDEMEFVFANPPCPQPVVLNPGESLVVMHGKGTSICTGAAKQLFTGGSSFLQKDGDDLALLDAAGRCVDYVAFEKGWNWGKKPVPPPADCVWRGPNPSNGDRVGVPIARTGTGPVVDTNSGADWQPGW